MMGTGGMLAILDGMRDARYDYEVRRMTLRLALRRLSELFTGDSAQFALIAMRETTLAVEAMTKAMPAKGKPRRPKKPLL